MNDVMKLLAQADNQLDLISVRGQDVFTMSKARAYLKAAFDMMRKEDERGAVSDDATE